MSFTISQNVIVTQIRMTPKKQFHDVYLKRLYTLEKMKCLRCNFRLLKDRGYLCHKKDCKQDCKAVLHEIGTLCL